ncbi:MAG: DUF4258 domain-containing protein [Verrucomicrobia bacterium]|nr:DUF4258 domain-containing protein [Verrucomicrobiota bacterium]
MAGYAFGKYGADIVIPGAAVKVAAKGLKGAQELGAIYKGLQTAEKTLVLESVAGLESSAKVTSFMQNKVVTIAEDLGFNSCEIAQLENIGKGVSRNVATSTQDINFANHALQRAVERGVAKEAILDALSSPLKIEKVKIDQLGKPSQRFIGKKAEVVINPETQQVISVNPTATKKFKKLNDAVASVEN